MLNTQPIINEINLNIEKEGGLEENNNISKKDNIFSNLIKNIDNDLNVNEFEKNNYITNNENLFLKNPSNLWDDKEVLTFNKFGVTYKNYSFIFTDNTRETIKIDSDTIINYISHFIGEKYINDSIEVELLKKTMFRLSENDVIIMDYNSSGFMGDIYLLNNLLNVIIKCIKYNTTENVKNKLKEIFISLLFYSLDLIDIISNNVLSKNVKDKLLKYSIQLCDKFFIIINNQIHVLKNRNIEMENNLKEIRGMRIELNKKINLNMRKDDKISVKEEMRNLNSMEENISKDLDKIFGNVNKDNNNNLIALHEQLDNDTDIKHEPYKYPSDENDDTNSNAFTSVKTSNYNDSDSESVNNETNDTDNNSNKESIEKILKNLDPNGKENSDNENTLESIYSSINMENDKGSLSTNNESTNIPVTRASEIPKVEKNYIDNKKSDYDETESDVGNSDIENELMSILSNIN